MRTSNTSHIDPVIWRTALDLLAGDRNRTELEKQSGLPKNGLSQRISGRVRTTTDDLIAVARATGEDVAGLLDDLGIISLEQIEGTPEFRAVYRGARDAGNTPQRRFIDRLEAQRFDDRATLDQFLGMWTDLFGARSDWRVEVRYLSGWRSAN